MTTATDIHIGLFFPTHNKSQMMKICVFFAGHVIIYCGGGFVCFQVGGRTCLRCPPMVRRGIFVPLSRCAFSLLWGARSARVRLLAAVFFDVLGLNSQLLEDFSIWCVRFVPETSYHLSNEGFRWMPELTGWENLSVGESYKGIGRHFLDGFNNKMSSLSFSFFGGGGEGLMGVILINFLSAQRWVFPQLYLKGIHRSGFVLDYDHFCLG